MAKRHRVLWIAAAALIALPLAGHSAPPWADYGDHPKQKRHHGGPPPWAPAHGYRAKQRGHYHYDDHEDAYVSVSHRIGIPEGRCNRAAVGSILGGVVGGVIGAKVGRHNDNEALGVVAGTVLGVLVGRSIGRNMDDADQQCTGQALERAETGQTITWRNPESGLHFAVTPDEPYHRGGRYCRDYTTRAEGSGRVDRHAGSACRNADGTWQLATGTRL